MAGKKKKQKGTSSTTSNGLPPPVAAAANTGDVDVQMQQVLQLLSARTRGQASNDEVERAVSQVLSTAGMGPPAATAAASVATKKQTAKKKASPVFKIKVDTEDYDFDDDDADEQDKSNNDNGSDSKKKAVAAKQKDPQEEQQTSAQTRKRKISQSKYDYDSIPMGKQGAKMMTAFGDGADPHPEVVSATLLGARRLLQVTIQDARALRRKQKQRFLRARADVAKDYTTKASRAAAKAAKLNNNQQEPSDHPQEVADAEMLYRAMSGHDKLAYDPKCGFDYDQLKALFPEEMRAYGRWNQLRDEYAAQTDDKEVATAAVEKENNVKEEDSGKEKEEEVKEKSGPDPQDDVGNDGGHILQRAIQFDIRTDNMDKGWYMKFSEHRKGSFLPRRIKQEGDSEWENNRKTATKGGKQEAGVWSKMPANSARFLHWVGFDLDKGLPPPNEETTNALGFLGYDFFGRIVEKAIFLKNLAKAKEEDEEVDERTILLELKDGEQLELSDIENAIDDPDIKPAAMYTSETTGGVYRKPAAQLYFGPGFEDRLEMELDEIVCGNTKRADLPEEEAKIRQAEDKLFTDIAVPPSTSHTFMSLLGNGENDDNDEEGTGSSPEKEVLSSTPKSQPKKRGRPRKCK